MVTSPHFHNHRIVKCGPREKEREITFNCVGIYNMSLMDYHNFPRIIIFPFFPIYII